MSVSSTLSSMSSLLTQMTFDQCLDISMRILNFGYAQLLPDVAKPCSKISTLVATIQKTEHCE